ncbi:DUF423 domain-containing protein [Marinicella meishanensis]|uniref:DUF423 domain-containing protein n=1 Tax=Marinicella meishanensis TaxID=2873263 RepID=UPI001CC03651|nr:DUF423 domain-containing protein [Marinicella sp. NBU2979]
MNNKAIYLVVAAVYGLTAVALGAMGTHLFGIENDARSYSLFQMAVFYQLSHAVLLMWLATQLTEGVMIRFAALALSFGIMLFCGGLYLLIWHGNTAISWVTPVGGSLIILAWLNLVIHGFSKIKQNK